MDFEVQYMVPGSARSSFSASTPFDETLDDDQQMLIDIEQNIANLERTISNSASGAMATGGSGGCGTKTAVPTAVPTPPRSSSVERKRSSALRSVRSLIRLGKQRPPKEKGKIFLHHIHELYFLLLE